MAQVDDFLAPRLLRPTGEDEDEGPRLEEALRALEAATTAPPIPSLRTLHPAPIWLRYRAWWPNSVITRAIQLQPGLAAWLDTALELDCLARTAPDATALRTAVAAARQAGLMPSESDSALTNPKTEDQTNLP